MSDTKKTSIAIELEIAPQSQGINIAKNSQQSQGQVPERSVVQEMPTISTLLGRKKLSGVVGTPAKIAQPPKFLKTLQLEMLDIVGLEKCLKKHRKSAAMQKLDMLGYLNTRFEICALFKIVAADRLSGVLGFGVTSLVESARAISITMNQIPATREILNSKMPFIGMSANLRSEDLAVWSGVGFSASEWFAILPVVKKNSTIAIWVAASKHASLNREVDEKELKRLRTILTEYSFED